MSVYYDGGYAVNAKSPNQEDALKLVRWMATKPFGDRFVQLLGNISPIPGVTIDDALLGRVSGLNAVSAPYIMLTYFRFESPTGSELLQNAVQRMMNGDETPQQVGDEITAGISKYYAPFQTKLRAAAAVDRGAAAAVVADPAVVRVRAAAGRVRGGVPGV